MAVVWVGKGETPRNTPRLTGVGSPVYEKTPFSQHTRERRGGARVCERYSYLTNTSGEEGADNLCCCHICVCSIPAALHTHPGITPSSSPCWSAASSPLQSVKNHPQKTQMLVFLCVHSQCAGRKVLSVSHTSLPPALNLCLCHSPSWFTAKSLIALHIGCGKTGYSVP